MTAPSGAIQEAAAELVQRTTKVQGLPLTLRDSDALARVAAILRRAGGRYES